jgi:hypothetical protein
MGSSGNMESSRKTGSSQNTSSSCKGGGRGAGAAGNTYWMATGIEVLKHPIFF